MSNGSTAPAQSSRRRRRTRPAHLVRTHLLREGYRVDAAGTAGRGLAAASRPSSFDAVITDMRLPDGLGLELLHRMLAAAARRALRRHDRLRLGGERGGGAQGRRFRLPHQAGGPQAVPQRGRLGHPGQRRRDAAAHGRRGRPAGRQQRAGAERAGRAAAPGRRVAAHAQRQGTHRQGGAQHGAGAGARRVRHRQGTGGARRPRLQPSRRRAVRRRELQRDSGDPAGSRILRRQEGLVHRRHTRTATAISRPRAAARCSSTRSATCRWPCSPSCCARSRSGRCARSARPRKTRWTCASSARRTRTWRPTCRPGASARICTTA